MSDQCETCEENIYFDKKNNEWLLVIRTGEWDYYNDGFVNEEISINYCPECGKKLTK